jgi:serine/threonine protein kinase
MKIASRTLRTGIAEYAIGRVVGEGGAGIVYEAKRDDAVAVAIKVLKPATATRDKLKRFRNELHFCLQNRDPALITVSDFGELGTDEGPATFYAMPYFPKTLRSLMKEGPTPERAYFSTVKILDTTEAAHLQKVWHRDLKPENFLCDPTHDALVLADFGTAHFHQGLLATTVDTGPGSRLANFQYSAPEQRRVGEPVDHRADLFALGLITNELFTGQVRQGAGYRRIADAAPAFAFLDDIVDLLVQQSPAARPATIDEVRLRLLALHKEAGSRQRLDALGAMAVPTTQPSDPLITSPPKLTGVDVRGETVAITLGTPVTSEWVQAFKSIDYGRCLMGADPTSFAFRGNQATLAFRYDALTPDTAQQIVDDFKRFLGLAEQLYASRVKAALAQQDESARQEIRRQLEEERRRQAILGQLRL